MINPACLSIVMCLVSLTGIHGAELLAPETSIAAAIDHYIQDRWRAENITPGMQIDDLHFLRRVSLDLAGRIPTQLEVAEYLEWSETERRERAVAHFLESADFAFHQRNELDLLLLGRIRKDNDWRQYLLTATKENRNWSTIFKEVITPEVEVPGEIGAAAYLRERVRELDDLTNDTAVLFFGVNISCAKCHDHPLVADWQQKHYFGMASFFKRTYQTKSRQIAEDFRGEVKFTTVEGMEHDAEFMFLTNVSIEEPEVEWEEERRKELEELIKKSKSDENAPPPEVTFRPRQEFVKLALQDNERSFFARNIVNRVWARFMGRGLIMPLDQLHADNPASHPDLMSWLVRDLRSHEYDLKRLIAGIVRSQAYAQSSRWTGDGDRPAAETFAVAQVRPLAPRQLSLSLTFATQAQTRLPGLSKPEDWEQQRHQYEERSNSFADLFPIPEESFQVGTDEALLFSNSERFNNEFLSQGDDRLIGQLRKLESDDEVIQTAFRAILTREPVQEEHMALQQFLRDRHEHRDEALRHLVWALLSSPEFRFNH